jgi:hypothetical protein
VLCVVAFFIFYIKKNEQAGSEPDCESENIDKGKNFIAPQVADSECKIIAEHNILV